MLHAALRAKDPLAFQVPSARAQVVNEVFPRKPFVGNLRLAPCALCNPNASLPKSHLVALLPRTFSEQWTQKRVRDILANEKYAGNALLQKKYVKDHLSKKLAWNHGELPMFYAEGTHPAIIDEATFQLAQARRAENRENTNTKGDISARYPFSSKIVCANCGKSYRRITCRGRAAWNCDTYVRNGPSACPAKKIPEQVLESITADVLGIPAFDAAVLQERIENIIVPSPNRLIFRFRDGQEAARVWADRSRSESWDDTARQRAREHTIEWRKRK